MQLLPQLQWLAKTDYTHVYYVDLKPTIAEVRMFTPDADHPVDGGRFHWRVPHGWKLWKMCHRVRAPDDHQHCGVPRTFYSAFFVLDITNPEVDPKLLWTFSDVDLGLTTSTSDLGSRNPNSDAITSKINEKMVRGLRIRAK